MAFTVNHNDGMAKDAEFERMTLACCDSRALSLQIALPAPEPGHRASLAGTSGTPEEKALAFANELNNRTCDNAWGGHQG